MADTRAADGDELWVGIPPGWIELVAHEDDAEAARWFDRLLDQTPDLFDESGRDILRRSYDEVRQQLPQTAVDSAGVLITTLADDEVTLWQFTITIVPVPPSGDVNVMAVVERFLASDAGRRPLDDPDDLVESFRTDDGRDGVAIHTTTAVSDGGRLSSNVPTAEPERLGVVYAAVRLNRPAAATADKLAVVTGVAPTVEQRLPMSIVAAQITLSARLRDGDSPPPPGRVDVDTTGRRRDEQPPAPAGGAS
jgi:hypothetical protein